MSPRTRRRAPGRAPRTKSLTTSTNTAHGTTPAPCPDCIAGVGWKVRWIDTGGAHAQTVADLNDALDLVVKIRRSAGGIEVHIPAAS